MSTRRRSARLSACLAAALLLPATAGAETCAALAQRIDDTVMGFHPPLEGRSAKSRKASLYSAPAAHCRLRSKRLAADTYLIIYTPFKGWLQVGYTDTTGEEQTAWLKEADVRVGPPLGPK